MEYVILERNGKFLVGKMENKRDFFWSKAKDEFSCAMIGLNKPAHFETLNEAKDFLRKRIKPDTYYKLDDNQLKKFICWFSLCGSDTEGHLILKEPKIITSENEKDAIRIYYRIINGKEPMEDIGHGYYCAELK